MSRQQQKSQAERPEKTSQGIARDEIPKEFEYVKKSFCKLKKKSCIRYFCTFLPSHRAFKLCERREIISIVEYQFLDQEIYSTICLSRSLTAWSNLFSFYIVQTTLGCRSLMPMIG